MRQVIKPTYDHGVHLQIVENDVVLVEDIFPSVPSAKEFAVKQLNEKLKEKELTELTASEINEINKLVS